MKLNRRQLMPENWETYKLGEIAGVQTGPFGSQLHKKDYVEIGTPIITVEHLGENRITYQNLPKVSETDKKRLSKYLIREGDVVFSRVGSVDRRALVTKKENNWLFSGRCLRVRPDEKIANGAFLSYFFGKESFKEHIRSIAVGATMPSLNTSILSNVEITLPPLQEQKSIASILLALDDKIELNLQMNKTLGEMALTLYKHWFVDFGPFQDGEFVDSELGEIPKGWEVKALEDIIKFSNGYAFKSRQLLKEEEPDCFHIFKMGHILKGGGLKPDGTKSWIKKSDCKALDKFILKTGDILMSMTDMKDNMTILGHTALMNEDNKYIVNQRVGLLRVANNYGIDYPFVFLLTNSTDFIQRLRNQANSGVQVNLSTNAIKSAKVVVPTKEVNVQFNNITLPYYQSINQNALENQTLTQLRDTLLPKLISGELRVKDAEKTLSEVL